MNKYKELQFFVRSQVDYYYKHPQLLTNPKHWGRFEAFKQILEFINDYKEVTYVPREYMRLGSGKHE